MANPGNLHQIQDRAGKVRAARDHMARQRWKDAFEILSPLEKKRPKDFEIVMLLAVVHENAGNLDEARACARRALKIAENPDARLLLGRCERMLGNTDEAIRQFERAERIDRLRETARILRGGALEESGRFEEARQIIEPMVHEANARAGAASPALLLEWTKLLIHLRRFDDAAGAADAVAAASGTNAGMKQYALLMKAKALDRAKRFAEAFQAATAANELSDARFDPELHETQATALIQQLSREHLERFPRSACVSELPVFIAGMPRSGTSLVDRIIDAHPSAAGVGEMPAIEAFAMRLAREHDPTKPPPECFGTLQDKEWTRVAEQYVRELTLLGGKGCRRVVNKSLGNYKLMPIIARLFPRTRFIHTIRDPRDVAVSCYMGAFNKRMFPWTSRLDWIAAAWEQSMRVMEHWKAVLDTPILDVRYEDLVRDPEPQFRRIIDFLGLDWDESCLGFHKSGRALRTLSYDQVTRPIYTSSVARHKDYAPFLEGVAFPHYEDE